MPEMLRAAHACTCVLVQVHRQVHVLCLLLKAGSDPTAENNAGSTPAQTARLEGQDMAAVLLERAEQDWRAAHGTQ